MNKLELELLKLLGKERKFKEIVSLTEKSKSLVSRVLKQLVNKDLVRKNDSYYSISPNPKSILILKVSAKYPNLLIGKREIVLKFLQEKRSLSEIQALTGISLKQLSTYLKEFSSYGIVLKEDGKYFLNKEEKDVCELVRVLSLEEEPGVVWREGKEKLKVSEEPEEGSLTAFSLFPRFGIEIFTPKKYYYFPRRTLSKEEIFVHALVFANNVQEKILATIFYAKFKKQMSGIKIFSLAKKFGVVDKLEEIKKLLKGEGSFVSYGEFMKKAEEYGIKADRVSSREDLIRIFEEIDSKLTERCRIYLTGGANMVLKGLKISTKDLDILVSKEDFDRVLKALSLLGFSCKNDICERNDLKIDIFREKILSGYRLSRRMKQRAELFWKGKNLEVRLLSLEDVFLFKSYAGREVDVDDCRILATQNLNWKVILEECLEQQKREKRLISLTLLDVLDELKTRYKIETPIERRLDSFVLRRVVLYCLRRPKSVKELVSETQRPETTLRKVLKELLKEGKIKIIKKDKETKFLKSLKDFHT